MLHGEGGVLDSLRGKETCLLACLTPSVHHSRIYSTTSHVRRLSQSPTFQLHAKARNNIQQFTVEKNYDYYKIKSKHTMVLYTSKFIRLGTHAGVFHRHRTKSPRIIKVCFCSPEQ